MTHGGIGREAGDRRTYGGPERHQDQRTHGTRGDQKKNQGDRRTRGGIRAHASEPGAAMFEINVYDKDIKLARV
jgi:hypothetical protein